MLEARLIQSGFCDAATNMAIDEALFLSYQENSSVPILRLYGWQPASFSFGCFQKPQDILNLEGCEKEGIPLVRRPTGGGLIFHNKEITYSLILAPSDLGLSLGVKESFEKITHFLISAYRSIGLEATFAKDIFKPSWLNGSRAEFCFSRSEEYDILIHGKKIGGNAQKRKRNLILQHGSVPFSFDKNRIHKFLKNPEYLQNLKITSLDELTNRKIDYNGFATLMIEAFSRYFQTNLKKSDLTPEEKSLKEELVTHKYANFEWNLYRKTKRADTLKNNK